jgi:polyisoprenoid-binding protein YceI
LLHRSLSFAFILVLLGLFAAGCSATSSAPAPSAPIAQAPTSAPQAVAPTAAPTATLAPVIAVSSNSSTSGNTVRLDIVADKSEARYRVREQLVNVSLPSDAIGKTNAISGSIVGKTDGTIDSAQSKFTVDMRTLQSDRSQRDNFLRGSVLQTNQYPYATFVPTAAPGLPLTVPPTGPVSFKLTGDLTIRNVTKSVTWDVNCDAPQGDQGTCHASTSFTFEDFNINQPRVPLVLSIVDHITLELDLVLQRASSS